MQCKWTQLPFTLFWIYQTQTHRRQSIPFWKSFPVQKNINYQNRKDWWKDKLKVLQRPLTYNFSNFIWKLISIFPYSHLKSFCYSWHSWSTEPNRQRFQSLRSHGTSWLRVKWGHSGNSYLQLFSLERRMFTHIPEWNFSLHICFFTAENKSSRYMSAADILAKSLNKTKFLVGKYEFQEKFWILPHKEVLK